MSEVAASPIADGDYVDGIKAAVERHAWNPIVVWQGIHRVLTATMEMVLSFHPEWAKLHAGVEHDEIEVGHDVAFVKQLSRSLNIDKPDMVFRIPTTETGLRVVAWLHEHGVVHFRKLQKTDTEVYLYTTLDSWVHLLERTLKLCDEELASVEPVESTAKGRKKLAYETIRAMCEFNVKSLRESALRRNAYLDTLDVSERRALRMADNLGATALRAACAAAKAAKAAKAKKPGKSGPVSEPIHEDEEEEEKKACVAEAVCAVAKAPPATRELGSEPVGDSEERTALAMEHRIARLKVEELPPSGPNERSPNAAGATPPTPSPLADPESATSTPAATDSK